jgi:hypothetical protein
MDLRHLRARVAVAVEDAAPGAPLAPPRSGGAGRSMSGLLGDRVPSRASAAGRRTGNSRTAA